MTIEVVIPTFNRCHLWKTGALFDSLKRQTCQDFRLVVADHGSADGTVDALRKLRSSWKPKFGFDVLRVQRIKDTKDSATTDNALFHHATADWVLHLDDDGYVHEEMIGFARTHLTSGPASSFGRIVCVARDGKIIKDDPRMTWVGSGNDITKLPQRARYEWGAIWIARREAIRMVGGHDIKYEGRRGCDNRLGWSLRSQGDVWFVGRKEFSFYHYGLSYFQTIEFSVYVRESAQPSIHGYDSFPVVVNNGANFWSSSYFDGLYEIVPT